MMDLYVHHKAIAYSRCTHGMTHCTLTTALSSLHFHCYCSQVLRPHRPLFVQNVTAQPSLPGTRVQQRQRGGLHIGEEEGEFTSQLGNSNDKRAFASWVRCDKEQQACLAARLLPANSSSSQTTPRIRPRREREGGSVLEGEEQGVLSHERGLPASFVLT